MIKSDTDADIKRYIHEKDMKVVRVSKSSGLAFAEK